MFSFLKGFKAKSSVIASQEPLPDTICDFWLMVLQCQVTVMASLHADDEVFIAVLFLIFLVFITVLFLITFCSLFVGDVSLLVNGDRRDVCWVA